MENFIKIDLIICKKMQEKAVMWEDSDFDEISNEFDKSHIEWQLVVDPLGNSRLCDSDLW